MKTELVMCVCLWSLSLKVFFLLMIWAMKTVRLFAYSQTVCMFGHHSLFSDLSYENRQAICMFFNRKLYAFLMIFLLK